MEGKAHRRRDYSPVGRMSRTERDLTSCSEGADCSPDSYTIIRKVMLHGRSGRIRKNPHVCVIGAGVAGLRCAEVLINKGAKVTILEGRDRLGGRVSNPRRAAEQYAKDYRFIKLTIWVDTW